MADQRFTYISAAVNLAKNGTRDIIAAPGAGVELWIYGLYGVTNADGNVTFLDSTPTTMSGVIPVLAATPEFKLPISANPAAPWFKCLPNTKFQVTLTTNVDWDGIVVYAKVPTPSA